VAKAEVCKTFIHRFKSDRRLHFFRLAKEQLSNFNSQISNNIQSPNYNDQTFWSLMIGYWHLFASPRVFARAGVI
jgi:hypothetical protein